MADEEALFRRPADAAALSRQLLHPGALDEGVRSGVFLSGIRRVGKTTFLRQDLIPARRCPTWPRPRPAFAPWAAGPRNC